MTEEETVTIEYFHHGMDKHVRITVPKSELLDEGGDFIVKGIERYSARIVENDEQ